MSRTDLPRAVPSELLEQYSRACVQGSQEVRARLTTGEAATSNIDGVYGLAGTYDDLWSLNPVRKVLTSSVAA